MIIIRDESIH